MQLLEARFYYCKRRDRGVNMSMFRVTQFGILLKRDLRPESEPLPYVRSMLMEADRG